MRTALLSQPHIRELGDSAFGARAHRDRPSSAAGGLRYSTSRCRNELGEVFPVAILFGGVLLTILIGLHVVLVSIGRTAVQAAADRGVTAAQSAPLGTPTCGTFGAGGRTVTPNSIRECDGVISTLQALHASGSMVRRTYPPDISVDEAAGVVTVLAHGAVISPVLGTIEIVGYACGPLDLVASGTSNEAGTSSRADASAC